MNQVIFKDKATATAGKKFFSLFPGLGYAAGYKASHSTVILCVSILIDVVTGISTHIQVRRTTICSRFPCKELWNMV